MSHTPQRPDEPGTDGSLSADISDVRSQISEMAERIDELESEVETLRDERDALRAKVESQSDRIEIRGNSHEMSNLWIDDLPVGPALELRRDEIDELATRVDELETEPAPDPEDTVEDDWTLAEKALAVGPDEVLNSASEKRAITILEHFGAWSSKTPGGNRVVRTGADKLKSLLETERDESLSWKQVYRSCEKLEILTEGHVEFVDERSKKLVCEGALPSASD